MLSGATPHEVAVEAVEASRRHGEARLVVADADLDRVVTPVIATFEFGDFRSTTEAACQADRVQSRLRPGGAKTHTLDRLDASADLLGEVGLRSDWGAKRDSAFHLLVHRFHDCRVSMPEYLYRVVVVEVDVAPTFDVVEVASISTLYDKGVGAVEIRTFGDARHELSSALELLGGSWARFAKGLLDRISDIAHRMSLLPRFVDFQHDESVCRTPTIRSVSNEKLDERV